MYKIENLWAFLLTMYVSLSLFLAGENIRCEIWQINDISLHAESYWSVSR